jgi:hypothetical protein
MSFNYNFFFLFHMKKIRPLKSLTARDPQDEGTQIK